MKSRGPRKRRIAVVTGTRADYGILKSTISAIAAHPRLELQLVVTGMHLLKKLGQTVKDIENDKLTIAARIPMQKGNDDPTDQAVGLALGVKKMALFFQEASTDLVLVLGDRIEALAGALAGVTTGRIVAHVHGGDMAPGDFDGVIRDAITKLAHIHFPATPSSERRVIALGEAPDRVQCVGAPGLDRLLQLAQRQQRKQKSRLEALIVQHPCGRSPQTERRVMTTILRAVADYGLKRTIIYPNTDRGHSGIIEAIEEHRNHRPSREVRVFRSLPYEAYLRRLLRADVLVGNSSSGVIEAAAAGTPAVNIGDRQKGRERDKTMVVDALETQRSVFSAIGRGLRLGPGKSRSSIYGDGKAGIRIARRLAAVSLDESFRRKLPRPLTKGI